MHTCMLLARVEEEQGGITMLPVEGLETTNKVAGSAERVEVGESVLGYLQHKIIIITHNAVGKWGSAAAAFPERYKAGVYYYSLFGMLEKNVNKLS